ncbi:MAG: sigma-54-dependent Fis family transcriptional regulator [Cytophagales bacterium]|nr:sigma-54-dependent Fis family transcriptional regulator [Cytophagales bacterium]
MYDMDVERIKRQFDIIGEDKSLLRAIERAVLVAATDLTILITGENGVGKDSFARIIHHYSKNKGGKFIAVNCGAIPQGTIDSELFGHEKGSFTGATEKRQGYFEYAEKGTIFLDEIGEMPLETQTKLLRVLENGEIMHVGSSKVQKINTRVIAATNVDLPTAVRRGSFREDLFYRLNCISISLPPLRERGRDIVLLFRKFANDFSLSYHVPPVQLDDDAEELILKYQFPGNIRQLRNITWQLSLFEREQRQITAEVLRQYIPAEEHMSLNIKSEEHYDEKEVKMLYKMIFELKKENEDIKKILFDVIKRFQNVPGQEAKTLADKLKIMDIKKVETVK